MNPFDRIKSGKQAEVRYLDSDFQVLTPGSYVRCAVTDTEIPLEELKYWSVTRQEAYVDADVAGRRYHETDAKVDHPNV